MMASTCPSPPPHLEGTWMTGLDMLNTVAEAEQSRFYRMASPRYPEG
jgi:hypothetical protein